MLFVSCNSFWHSRKTGVRVSGILALLSTGSNASRDINSATKSSGGIFCCISDLLAVDTRRWKASNISWDSSSSLPTSILFWTSVRPLAFRYGNPVFVTMGSWQPSIKFAMVQWLHPHPNTGVRWCWWVAVLLDPVPCPQVSLSDGCKDSECKGWLVTSTAERDT